MQKTIDRERLGRNIRTARLDALLTQEALARRLETGHSTISDWEHGRGCPNVLDLCIIAKVTGTSLNDLMKGTY